MYLVDTCAFSEFTKPRPERSVDRWFAETEDAAKFVSVLTLGELEKGVEKLPPGRRKDRLRAWLTALRGEIAPRTLAVTDEIATEWGRLCARSEAKGAPLPVIDALIAATALVHRLTVVTRNTADMARTGARIFDPWRA